MNRRVGVDSTNPKWEIPDKFMKNIALYLATMLMLLGCSLTAAQPKTFSVATFGAVGDGNKEKQQWKQILSSGNYTDIARAYADVMIKYGRDVYGKKHTPLFITGMDRKTLKKIRPPFPHVKRKPFMPGWERDREHRGSDLNYGQADPLDQLTLLKLMHKLTEITGDKHYAEEANKTAAWWMKHGQSPIGLYPWGTHTYWNVDRDGGSGRFEYNHLWPYWKQNSEAMHRYAMGLWDHYVKDKNTGNFNRHAHSHKHGPDGGMEFPWPGSSMIGTWVEAWLDKPDAEYLRAIRTILKRWESLRDKNGHLAPCSNYQEWTWYLGSMLAANRLDDYAELIAARKPDLARKMRDYGRKNDTAYLKVAHNLLDIKGFGPVKSYLRATGGYNPERLDLIGGPWQDRKDYAGFALMLHERMKRNKLPALQTTYRKAVLDTAEIYMSINPEVQWSVWGVNIAHAMELMLVAQELTGNGAYLHRADHFTRLAVTLLLDETSPLPKLTSHDDFYEIESITEPSTDVWLLVALDVQERLAAVGSKSDHSTRVTSSITDAWDSVAVTGASTSKWRTDLKTALSENRAGIWDCRKSPESSASVSLSYGEKAQRTLFLSSHSNDFSFSKMGLSI